MSKTSIINVDIVFADGMRPGSVTVEDGKIAAVHSDRAVKDAGSVIDGAGRILAPGYIDMHNHGNSGHDAMDATEEALRVMAEFHLEHGVTSFLATTMTASEQATRAALETAGRYCQKTQAPRSAELLGVYMEGPYFSMERKGAQPAEFIQDPDRKQLEAYLDAVDPLVKVVSLAPELPGAQACIDMLAKRGVTVAIGHSDAKLQEAEMAIEHGVTQATHLFNGMRPFTHREPGIVGAVLLAPQVCCELIADGIHVHPRAIELALACKGTDGLVLISDAMRATGLADGFYDLGGQQVEVKGREARLADGVLAGSTLTLDVAVANLVRWGVASLPEAVRMASLNPARQIGVDRKKGSIEVGKDADLIFLDEHLGVSAVLQGDAYLSFEDRP